MGKSWWERVVILTTSDDSLNRSDIDYIEASLISKASSTGRLDCDNKNMGNKQKVSKFREVELEQYLEEALFLLELIGVNVFCAISKKKSMSKTELIASIKNSSKDQVELRDKKEAIRFLIENGINVGKNMNYSKRQDNKNVFWINPRTNAIEKDWDLILNNQYENEIIVLHIPAGSFQLKSEEDNGLLVRHDKPDRIDLTISDDTLIDQRSKCEFSMYVVKKIKY